VTVHGARTVHAAVMRYVRNVGEHDVEWRWHHYMTRRLCRVHSATWLAEQRDYDIMRALVGNRRSLDALGVFQRARHIAGL
jgi:hypothetical protein